MPLPTSQHIAGVITALGLLFGGCTATIAQGSKTSISSSMTRRPLGMLAFEISQRTGIGIVIAEPQFHDIPFSIYFPETATEEQIITMFKAALHSNKLQATDKGGYWLIETLPPTKPAVNNAPIQANNRGMVMDLDQVRLAVVTRSLSKVAGYRFIVAPGLADHLVTIQALRPVPPEEALMLLVDTLMMDGILVDRTDNTLTIERAPEPSQDTVDDGLVIPKAVRQRQKRFSNQPIPDLQ